MYRRRMNGLALVAALLPLSLSCGGGGADHPSPAGVRVEPSPAPPTPTATAAPATLLGCNLPPVDSAEGTCRREGAGDFTEDVDAAIALVLKQEPDIFEGTYILSHGRYRLGVIRNLQAKGLCAGWDNAGHGELQVKNSNGFSEQYHISLSSGHVRRGEGAYRATCYPALFPLAAEPLVQRGDCALPSSRDVGCGRETSKYLSDVDAAINEAQAQRPELFRGESVVGSPDDYYALVAKNLRTKGFCAIFDGHDIAVKNSNELNEQFHVLYSWGQIRRGDSSYRASCYPAAF